MRSSFSKIIIGFTFLAIAFASGVLFHKYKIFPYHQLRGAAKRVKMLMTPGHRLTAEAVKGQLSRDPVSAHPNKNVETILLPLELKETRISELYDFPKTGGGLTIVNDCVVIIDRLGEVYVHEHGKFEQRSFPKLPNNIAAFVSSSSAPLSPSNFRVHDIEYVDFAGVLAVSHEYFDSSSNKPRLAVSTIEINPQTISPLGAWKTVFRGDTLDVRKFGYYPGMGGGGRLTIRRPDKLILTAGDYVQDGVTLKTPWVAQDPEMSFGKIFEINLTTLKPTVLSRGHRNPQGLVVTDDDRLFSTEHGQSGGDELNLIEAGANYGWPNVTLGVDYGTYSWPNAEFAGEHDGFSPPTFAWVPSIAVSNLIQVKGFHRRWDRDILVASLKAMSLFRLRFQERRVMYAEQIWIGERIRDIAQLRNGAIVLWTDDAKLLFLTVDHARLEENKQTREMIAPPVMAACMSCHHFGPTNPSHPGPTLSNLVGRKIASDSFSRYSAALMSREETWTKETLSAFIANPNKFANGTLMPKPDITEDDVVRIVSILEELSQTP